MHLCNWKLINSIDSFNDHYVEYCFWIIVYILVYITYWYKKQAYAATYGGNLRSMRHGICTSNRITTGPCTFTFVFILMYLYMYICLLYMYIS